ncbi:hypothetical protein ACFYMO_03820 [Streptomyces sp. NPDC007025]|uniref:hypothetical protein n=1 Tax=Streptomyces sp. NPDC007025 TaxID=3364771 RepID=UPI0036A0F34D
MASNELADRVVTLMERLQRMGRSEQEIRAAVEEELAPHSRGETAVALKALEKNSR